MKKENYLSKEVVKNFVQWMAHRLDSEIFSHKYTNRKTGIYWACGSLFEAYQNYNWTHSGIDAAPGFEAVQRGITFDSNNAALQSLQTALKKAMNAKNHEEADRLLAEACKRVMAWGGVRAGNVNWLSANQNGLKKTLLEVSQAIDESNLEAEALNHPKLRFNAGMTKVYSLLCKNFIIYDSRVAAALGWIVVKYCQEKNIGSVPPELAFPWAPAKEGSNAVNPKRRNPSCGNLNFPRLKSSFNHAKWNMKASWLLDSILRHQNAFNSGFNNLTSQQLRLRGLEAALFMIGYDLGGKNLQPVRGESEWSEGFTPSRGNHFKYQVTSNGVQTRNLDGRFNVETNVESIAKVLETLRGWFSGGNFFLRHNMVAIPEAAIEGFSENEKGVGAAYYITTNKSPHNTSRLVPVLEDLGILVRLTTGRRNSHQWMLADEYISAENMNEAVQNCINEYLIDEEEA